MVQTAMTLSDLEGHLCCLNLSNSHTSGNIVRINYDSHVHGKSGNISVMVRAS